MPTDVNRELERAPLGAIVQNLGTAIAQAQKALDRMALDTMVEMSKAENGITLPGETEPRSLLELGFLPSFYHFNQATIEARVTFSSMSSDEKALSAGISAGAGVGPIAFVAAHVSASYTQKYSFEASGSSMISTQLVSIPPPAALMRLLADSKPD